MECNGSLEHLLLQCETLSQCYKTQMNMIEHLSPPSRKIVLNAKSESLVSFMQLLLDPSVIPEAIKVTKLIRYFMNFLNFQELGVIMCT